MDVSSQPLDICVQQFGPGETSQLGVIGLVESLVEMPSPLLKLCIRN